MANIVDMFKIWSDSPHTAALQDLLNPSPGYAQQYLSPMSPNNPFGLQERAMGLLGGMQQASNQAVMPQSPPTQYVEPTAPQAPAPAAGPFMVYRSFADPTQTAEGTGAPLRIEQAMFDPSLPGGGIEKGSFNRGGPNDWMHTYTVPEGAQSYGQALQFQKMSGLFG